MEPAIGLLSHEYSCIKLFVNGKKGRSTMNKAMVLPDSESRLLKKPNTLKSRRCINVICVISGLLICTSLIATVTYLFLQQQHQQHEIDYIRKQLQAVSNRTAMSRLKRQVTSSGTEVKPTSKSKKGKRKNDRKDRVAAHFQAGIDRHLIARQKANGEPTIGDYTENGFKPNDKIYRIWQPTNWTSNRIYDYDSDTGKVTVKKPGLYLIYAQVLFHGPSARKSFGIHVNDETMPVVESIAFDVVQTASKQRRDLSSILRTNTGSDLSEDDDDDEFTETSSRTKRSTQYAKYNQCSTMVVVNLKKGYNVFLKSFESGRTIIPQPSLTFWGLSKLQ